MNLYETNLLVGLLDGWMEKSTVCRLYVIRLEYSP
jgi:hypothetical protein